MAIADAHAPGLAARLAALARSRDPAAWAAIVAAVGEDLRRVVVRLVGHDLADDAVQEALLRIRDDAGRFAPPEEGDPDAAARRWAVAVAAHAALNLARSRQRAAQRGVRAAAASPAVPPPPPEADVERAEAVGIVRAALAAIPPVQSAVLSLRFLDGAEPADIARCLGLPLGTVKSHQSRGLERLRRLLRRHRLDGAMSMALLAAADPGTAGAGAIARAGALLGAPPAASPPAVFPRAADPVAAALPIAAAALLLAGAGFLAISAPAVPAADRDAAAAPGPPATAATAAAAEDPADAASSSLHLPPDHPLRRHLESLPAPARAQAEAGLRAMLFPAMPADGWDGPGMAVAGQTGGSSSTWTSFGSGDLAPPAARARPGERILVPLVADPAMTRFARLLERDGRRRVAAWRPDGTIIADAPAGTPAERAALTPAIADLFGPDFAASGAIAPGLEDAAAPTPPFSAHVTTRDGRPWLRCERDGIVLFDGPVGTAEERDAIPPAVWGLLGDEFAATLAGSATGPRLKVVSGQGQPSPAPVAQ